MSVTPDPRALHDTTRTLVFRRPVDAARFDEMVNAIGVRFQRQGSPLDSKYYRSEAVMAAMNETRPARTVTADPSARGK